MTRDEYVAKGMLLGLIYLDSSHTYTDNHVLGCRMDPDTVELLPDDAKYLLKRMDDIAAGKIGPLDGKYRGYDWGVQASWQELIAKGSISDANGPLEHEENTKTAKPVDVLFSRIRDRRPFKHKDR